MGLYRVGVKDGQKVLEILAGSTRGEGCPLGMWTSFENDIAPNDNWIKEGTTFDETKYPALYLYLGSNKVPEYKSEAGKIYQSEETYINTQAWSNYTFNFTTSVPKGRYLIGLWVSDSNNYSTNVFVKTIQSVNGKAYSNPLDSNNLDTTASAFITQSYEQNSMMSAKPMQFDEDVSTMIIQCANTGANKNVRLLLTRIDGSARGYMYIKATSNMSESEVTGLLNLITQRESYSTEEVNTGKKWIDGKTIYRVVRHTWEGNSVTQGYTYNSSNFKYTGLFTTNADTVTEISALFRVQVGTHYEWCRQFGQGWNAAPNIIWQANNEVYHNTAASYQVDKVYIIIEYTKTTD